jgi:hypothetical protein
MSRRWLDLRCFPRREFSQQRHARARLCAKAIDESARIDVLTSAPMELDR